MEKFNQTNMDVAKQKIEAYQDAKRGFVPRTDANPKNQNQTKKEELKIVFEKEKFAGTHQTMITTTTKLATMIATKLSKVFSDLAGAIIVPGSYGQPDLILYFKDTPAIEGKRKALILLKDKNASKMGDQYSQSAQAIANMTMMYKSNKLYDLTDDAKEMLKRFMVRDNNGNVNWGQKITETTANGMMNGEILVKLGGLNIIEFIKSIYGYKYITKDNNGADTVNIYDYTVVLMQPVNNGFGGFNPNMRNSMLSDYAISISAIDRTELNKVAQIFGQPSVYGTTPMCTPEL